MLRAMIPRDNQTKGRSIFDSCSSAAGSKYLNGVKYFKNSKSSFNPAITEMKYVPSSMETATDPEFLCFFIALPRKMPIERKIICMINRDSIPRETKL